MSCLNFKIIELANLANIANSALSNNTNSDLDLNTVDNLIKTIKKLKSNLLKCKNRIKVTLQSKNNHIITGLEPVTCINYNFKEFKKSQGHIMITNDTDNATINDNATYNKDEITELCQLTSETDDNRHRIIEINKFKSNNKNIKTLKSNEIINKNKNNNKNLIHNLDKNYKTKSSIGNNCESTNQINQLSETIDSNYKQSLYLQVNTLNKNKNNNKQLIANNSTKLAHHQTGTVVNNSEIGTEHKSNLALDHKVKIGNINKPTTTKHNIKTFEIGQSRSIIVDNNCETFEPFCKQQPRNDSNSINSNNNQDLYSLNYCSATKPEPLKMSNTDTLESMENETKQYCSNKVIITGLNIGDYWTDPKRTQTELLKKVNGVRVIRVKPVYDHNAAANKMMKVTVATREQHENILRADWNENIVNPPFGGKTKISNYQNDY